MGINIFNDDFTELLEALEFCEVENVLVGGYSVIIHGYSWTTGDMDIYINPKESNYNNLKKAFLKFGMSMYDLTLEAFLDTENFDVFEFGRSPVAIYIITKLKGVAFDEAYNNRIRFQLHESLSINVIHINTLIKSKIAAGRAKDINDIEHLKNKSFVFLPE